MVHQKIYPPQGVYIYGPLVKWPKTPASHAGNMGSNPVRVTKKPTIRVERYTKTSPQSCIFWFILPKLFSQGVCLTSPNLNINPSKSTNFEVVDFLKRRFLFRRGKNGANTRLLASILTTKERKSTFKKRCFGVSFYPICVLKRLKLF